MPKPPLRVLFVCARNRLRSPTAEHVFATWPGVEASSAGLAPDADVPLTAEDVVRAYLVFAMEKRHVRRLRERFWRHLNGQRVCASASRTTTPSSTPPSWRSCTPASRLYLPRA